MLIHAGIGAHAMDGPGGTLAHAYYPPPNGITIAGDLHFDEAEAWYCDPAQIVGTELDIGIVALHEIGHSIGLGHETIDPAVLEALDDETVLGPVRIEDQIAVVDYTIEDGTTMSLGIDARTGLPYSRNSSWPSAGSRCCS